MSSQPRATEHPTLTHHQCRRVRTSMYVHTYPNFMIIKLYTDAPHSNHPPSVYKVLTSHMQPDCADVLPAQHIFCINTGAPLPVGTDAVVMVEDTQLVAMMSGPVVVAGEGVGLAAATEKTEVHEVVEMELCVSFTLSNPIANCQARKYAAT
jgi:hypothetical protein